MVDGTSYPVSTSQFNNDEAVNYAVADQYNNAMRYPDEMAAYKAVTAAAAADAINNGVTLAERRDRNQRTHAFLRICFPSRGQFRANSMVINLHGELLPLPPPA